MHPTVSWTEFDALNSRVIRLETELAQVRGRGVEKTPGVCGGSARIVRTRVPVWSLESFRRLGVTEAQLLASYPSLNAADLVNAWAYVSANREEIDRDILANEED